MLPQRAPSWASAETQALPAGMKPSKSSRATSDHLNHAGIATLYGLESADGIQFLAMELVDGETLAERIDRGPIAVEDALPLAVQITEAEAMEAAQEKKIVHRDLKPANIKLTEKGEIKVLDFGLAKALAGEDDDAAPDLSQSRTLSRHAMVAGVVLGTPPYISPEQAKGKRTDRRADIWSFGVALFEMLTGRRLFTGETVSDVLAAVLRAETDWQLLPAETPLLVRRVLRRCLTRDPKQRLHDIADARLDLKEALSSDAVDSEIAPTKTVWQSSGLYRSRIVSRRFENSDEGSRARARPRAIIDTPLVYSTRSPLQGHGRNDVHRLCAGPVLGEVRGIPSARYQSFATPISGPFSRTTGGDRRGFPENCAWSR